MGLGPELAEGWSADQVRLEIEDVVDGGVGGEKPLGRGPGLELLLLSLPPPDRQMRVLRPITLPHPARSVTIHQPQIPGRGPVRSQLVGDDCLGMDTVAPEQLPQQLQRCGFVRRSWTSMSRTSPSSSTARHRNIRLPPIFTTISSRCQMPAARRPGPRAPQVGRRDRRTSASSTGSSHS